MCNAWWWTFTRLILVITLSCVQALNHVVHLKLMLHVNYTSIIKKRSPIPKCITSHCLVLERKIEVGKWKKLERIVRIVLQGDDFLGEIWISRRSSHLFFNSTWFFFSYRFVEILYVHWLWVPFLLYILQLFLFAALVYVFVLTFPNFFKEGIFSFIVVILINNTLCG